LNKEKSLKRQITRLRKVQNPSSVDLKRIRRLRDARTELWRLRKKPVARSESKARPVKEAEKEKPAKPEKEPELEVLDEELEELFDVDEDEEPDADDTDS
jgi:hypothetical protein